MDFDHAQTNQTWLKTTASFLRKVGIWPRECARTIENISRIRMDVARASGTDLASSLRQNMFLIEEKQFLMSKVVLIVKKWILIMRRPIKPGSKRRRPF